MATAKKASKKSSVSTVLARAKKVAGDLLAGAASGAVVGAAESAVVAAGVKWGADPQVTGDRKAPKTKETAAKSASATKKSGTSAAKKTAATKKTTATKAAAKPAARKVAKKTK